MTRVIRLEQKVELSFLQAKISHIIDTDMIFIKIIEIHLQKCPQVRYYVTYMKKELSIS